MVDYITRESGLQVPSGTDVQLTERIAELEFALEDRDWLRLDAAGVQEFSRQGLHSITRIARLMYLKNPLIKRGVNVKADYIFAQGVNISAREEELNEVVQAFLDDPQNQVEFTSHQNRIAKEVALQVEGNIFFAFFVHPITGTVRTRTIPCDEITDIITDPDDAKKPQYYKREWTQKTFDFSTGQYKDERKTAYYRDWRYNDPRQTIADKPVEKAVIYHIKVGGFNDWRFGVSEVYQAIDWAKAYKTFLENWATITAAYARFAWKVTASGGKPGVEAATRKLSTTLGKGSQGEKNPPPTTGSSFVRSQSGGVADADIDPIKTAGATTKAEDGRNLKLMVATSFGIPETFYSDVSTGNLATAKSLDRPTELMFLNRQALWRDVYLTILAFVAFQSVKAPAGKLRGIAKIQRNEYGEEIIVYNDDVNSKIDVDFPPITENDLQQYMDALTKAAAYIPNPRILAKYVLNALGERDIDEVLDLLYPPDQELPVPQDQEQEPSELSQAAEALREAITLLYTKINGDDQA